MFKKFCYFLLTLAFIPVALGWVTLPVQADVEIGKPAPNFTATDIYGKEVKLSDLKGKRVVLEWTNHLCPFVRKQYGTGNMQATQEKATKDGVVWLSIVSSAPGKQGNVTPAEAQKIVKDVGAKATTRILDPSGKIGRLYGAKTTPHMFVIDKNGNVAYEGAIDDKPSPDPKSVEDAKNLVLAALDDLDAGKKVEVPFTVPYGCSVKY